MNNLSRACTTVLACLPLLMFSQSAPIVIDGLFDDWDASLATFTDAPETIAGIDLLEFQVTNDDEYLFIHFVLDTEISLVDNLVNHGVRLYIDTDNDASTGFVPQTGLGAELGTVFRDRFSYYNVVPSSTISFSDIGLRREPTITSNEYEIAIRRDAIPDGVNPLFPSNTIKILFDETFDNDEMPNFGSSFLYTFDETPVGDYVPVALERTNMEDLRAMAYNCQNNLADAGLQDEFERIFQALDADIIGLSECAGTSAAAVKAQLDSWLPLGNANGWYTIKDDYDMITASKWEITNSWDLDRQIATLIDLPNEYTTDLLFVSAHLKCCGDGNVQRQAQVDEFASLLLDAKSLGGNIDLPFGTPFIYCGDLNLVGYAQQYETIVSGDIQDTSTWGPAGSLDWDDTDILDAIPLHADQRQTYTWRDDTSSFPAGRIDFFFYSDAVMNSPKAYCLDTDAMSPTRLGLYGLVSTDTQTASDHLPLVFDMELVQLPDTDMDGIADDSDNCIDDPNPGQEDWNNNGIGDVCEDSDLDGLSDADELILYGTDPSNNDTDNDNLEDAAEVNIHLTDPTVQDSDGDGLTDGLEVSYAITDPTLFDTDNDGCDDAMFFNYQCPGQTTGADTCPVDTNADGEINILDLVNISSNFGLICP